MLIPNCLTSTCCSLSKSHLSHQLGRTSITATCNYILNQQQNRFTRSRNLSPFHSYSTNSNYMDFSSFNPFITSTHSEQSAAASHQKPTLSQHAIVATTKDNQLKNPSLFSSQSEVYKYLPLGEDHVNTASISSQRRICRDDTFNQIHYICMEEYNSNEMDHHFFQQFSQDSVNDACSQQERESRLFLEMRDLGEQCMKRILQSISSPKSKSAQDSLQSSPQIEITLDQEFASNQAFVEGLYIGNYNYKKSLNAKLVLPTICIFGEENKSISSALKEAKIAAQSEMAARFFMDLPSNFKTPTKFCDFMERYFANTPNVTVHVRDQAWIEDQKMGALLGVSQGSTEEPRVLEIFYEGDKESSDETALQLVGKGITFDTGGISLKPPQNMKNMKGDMGGAAAVVASMKGIAEMGPKINVRAICGLCENMPDGRAVKPGDVVRAANGKTIEVDNTDAEGRLILADTLHYATSTYNPKSVLTLATLTGAMVVSLGSVASGVFSTHNSLWKQLETAGLQTNDYMWRMPHFSHTFVKRLKSDVSDLCNMSNKPEAGSAAAAAFLSEFVHFKDEKKSSPQFGHIDIAGTAMHGSKMTGKPTRALIQLAKNMSKKE